MDHRSIIHQLSQNKNVFQGLFQGCPAGLITWKPSPEKWCLLEVLCHLYDEEREDFRARVKHVLTTPQSPLPPIDPVGWVISRSYMQQNFNNVLKRFLNERMESVQWLESLSDPAWKNAYQHQKFGALSAEMFLANWLAHDYLHFRQLTAIKFQYLKSISGDPLQYAGEW